MKENKNEFKVGDWVISTSWIYPDPKKIIKIELASAPDEEDFVFFREDWCVEMKYIEKWIPEVDEYCWFYKKNSKNPVFAKFIKLLDNNIGNFVAKGFTPNGTDKEDKLEYGYFYSCEPFKDKLPSGLKEN